MEMSGAGGVVAVALRDIEPGEELLFHYGEEYWLTRLATRVRMTQDIYLFRLINEYIGTAGTDCELERLRLYFGNDEEPALVDAASGAICSPPFTPVFGRADCFMRRVRVVGCDASRAHVP